jgi:hypothetical protein
MDRRLRRHLRSVAHLVFFGWTMLSIFGGIPCIAADKAKIQVAIRKAQEYLAKQKLSGAQGSIASLALVKSGFDRNALVVQDVLKGVLLKVQSGEYRPSQHHIYEAAVDLMLLEAFDPVLYRPQMEAAAKYIIGSQLPSGAWYYPNREEPDCGDTSITQYAMMGLWAATRAGIDVPTEVWEKTITWHAAKQMDDGGFAYHPFDKRVEINPEERTTSSAMTVAGTSSLLIARRMLFGNATTDINVKPANSGRRFGVVEKFVDDKVTTKRDVTLRISAVDDALKSSVRWMTTNFGAKSHRRELFYTYELYSIERVAALLDVERFGNHNWYDEGSDELLSRQSSDGSWNDTSTSVAATAMGLMFLTKVTATLITPPKRVAMLGGGLQAGGRGLPDNLGAVQVRDGSVSARKMVGAVDNLLLELERSSDAKVEDVQAAVVDAVQLDRPEELIGQIARLRKLAVDSRLEVRRTAIWALGRSGDVSATPSLIRGLADPDLSVVREASLALCILSRRPEGCDKAVDPTDDLQMGLKPEVTDEQRQNVFDAWRTESIRRWTEWYQKNRSYDERDDRTTLKKTNK